jgi:hypothetical protein
MSHTIRLNDDLGVIVLRFRKDIDFDEVLHAFGELGIIPGFKSGLKLVADFRESTTLLNEEDVRRVADYLRTTNHEWGVTKWSMISSSDLTYGLGRMFETLTNRCHVSTHIFRTVDDAADWLDLDIPMFEILYLTPDGIPAGKQVE